MIQYARADVSAPLDEYMEKDPELKDNFLPSILDAAKVDGKYYGIPGARSPAHCVVLQQEGAL